MSHRRAIPRLARAALLLTALVPPAAGCGRADDRGKAVTSSPVVAGDREVPFVATDERIVDRMLELAEVRPDDVVYDLGCGDGRIVVAAAKKYGCKAVGVEIDPRLVEQAKENARKAGVEDRVTIRQGDIFQEEFRDATVVMLYLLPEVNVRLMPKLSQLREGARVVSHSFAMHGARPEKVETVLGKKVYLWRVPWQAE